MTNAQSSSIEPFAMVIFGGAGDLAQRKLFPALYTLHRSGFLPENFSVLGVGRSPRETKEYRQFLRKAVMQYARIKVEDENDWSAFAERFDYLPVDVNDASSYKELAITVANQEKQFSLPGNRLFYLAVAPELFGTVAENLKAGGLTEKENGWKRLVIEKPFGRDYQSAKSLQAQINGSFPEDEVYRIDHYLGKEMVQNIEMLRFANSLFENLWNNRYISNVQITAAETVGVENRASYYDHAGALRDMVQNHILQLLMMVAMEPPSRLKPEAIHDEKVKVLRSLRRYDEEDVDRYIIRGQYTGGLMDGKEVPSYVAEENVPADSVNETFVAGKLYIDNFRWSGVPFYIRTGKRMDEKSTEVVIQFRDVPKNLYFNKDNDLGPNLLVIKINPEEGLALQINAKKPGVANQVVPIVMDFCNNCGVDTPEAYESLIRDALEGDRTFFTHWEEVSLAWKFIDPIRRAWDKDGGENLATYEAGSQGPKESDALLNRDGFQWYSPYHPMDKSVIHGQEINE
ncbi:glucose-6-phosphate dehydrogenase [Marininema halotolerans]|uniref:Glucose-6-phosphate 1-dehydrogenase n=1 Tax=Marininema halotolerans TaxID=1155944 RepID=A0A1I6RQQ0_9BACL|nr:glucose-6-phosphate dehydrogenase [Marininema halotolerans]SFS66940.1 glucose-6-phosphate 1-dehydrogenase [Marininema halotolerans]